MGWRGHGTYSENDRFTINLPREKRINRRFQSHIQNSLRFTRPNKHSHSLHKTPLLSTSPSPFQPSSTFIRGAQSGTGWKSPCRELSPPVTERQALQTPSLLLFLAFCYQIMIISSNQYFSTTTSITVLLREYILYRKEDQREENREREREYIV